MTKDQKVKFMFYEVASNKDVFDYNLAQEVGTFAIQVPDNISLQNLIPKCLVACNSRLRDFLLKKGIKHFIPYSRFTFDTKGDTLEICYYFAREMYKTIYETDPKYVMMPTGPLLERLDYFYEMYHFDGSFYDERARAFPDVQ